MPLRLIEATDDHKPLFQRLLQLYLHDVSEYSSVEPQDDGLYCFEQWDSLWDQTSLPPLIVMLRGRPAGFMLLRLGDMEAKDFQLTDIFILKCYRRLGIGEEVSRMLFTEKPGKWRIEVPEQNDIARAFWRQVMRRYTYRRYNELPSPTSGGVIFEFESQPVES